MNRQAKQKYRPVLTAEQITYLLALCKESPVLSSTCISCIHTLSVYQTKIDNLGITPAYTTSPRKSLVEKLGESSDLTLRSKEDVWATSYERYVADPASCSLATIQDAREHMYLHELMTPEEVVSFEQELAKLFNREGDNHG